MLQTIVNFIAPPSCVVCDLPNCFVCDDCAQDGLVGKVPSCFGCNKLTPVGQTCPTCRRKAHLSGVVVMWRLEGVAKQLIYSLKYKNDRTLAKFIATRLALGTDFSKFDLVTSVASDGESLRRRGYNQAELLAKALATQSGLLYRSTLLRPEHTSQVKLSRSKRLESVQGNFVCYRSAVVKGKRVLIVDDVLTTGATLNECAKILKEAGAKQVWGVVAAKK